MTRSCGLCNDIRVREKVKSQEPAPKKHHITLWCEITDIMSYGIIAPLHSSNIVHNTQVDRHIFILFHNKNPGKYQILPSYQGDRYLLSHLNPLSLYTHVDFVIILGRAKLPLRPRPCHSALVIVMVLFIYPILLSGEMYYYYPTKMPVISSCHVRMLMLYTCRSH